MAIGAISGISFTSYKKNNTTPVNKFNTLGNTLKPIPLAFILVTAPVAWAEAGYPVGMYFPNTNKIEQVEQSRQKADVIVRDTIRHKNEMCRFTQYNNDSIRSNTEFLGFNYKVRMQDGSIGSLTGIFQAICPEKTEDNKYLVTYNPILVAPEERVIKTCYVPEEFGDYILNFANSDENNNAVDIFGKKDFENAFGKETISNSPDIRMSIEKITPPMKKANY